MRTPWQPLLGLCCIALVSACAPENATSPPGARVAVTIAPLNLPGVTEASWRLTVSTATATVWTRDLTSRAYGDGSGSLAYVGPCDADAGANTVTVELLALYGGASGTELIAPATYDDPGPVSRTVTCLRDGDVAVPFDLTLARAATQGFFDIGVTFDDLFCSAKLDCQKPDGSPILLLADATGARQPTVVLGFACTADTAAEDTVLYLDPLVVSCNAGANTATLDPSAGPGNLTAGAGLSQPAATPALFGAAVYRGAEDLGGVGKLYWNLALGLALGTDAAKSCTLATQGTASSGPLPASATPAGSTYPYIVWSAPLTSSTAALSCTQHALGAGPEVAIAYAAPDAPEPFAYAFSAAPALPVTLVGAGTALDPTRWSDGSSATSCAAYLDAADDTLGSGVFAIDPDGLGPILVYCDMTTAGGGWTLLMRFTDAESSDYPADAPVWSTGLPAVAADAPVTLATTGTSPAYSRLRGNTLLFRTHLEAEDRWARFAMPRTETLLSLVGTTNLSAASDGYKDTLTAVSCGAAALSCWCQDWRVSWRNYGSDDGLPDSSVFAPSGLTSSVRPCGGSNRYATGVGVRTDTSNGWSGYGASWEGVGADLYGNPALAGESVSIWIGGP